MSKEMQKIKGISAESLTDERLMRIKQTAIVAMFSDDELMDILVLKGGNAMDIVHQVNARASIDLDFSMADDLDLDAVLPRVRATLLRSFERDGYKAFDIKMTSRPGRMPDELAAFWGGYLVEFKLISMERALAVGGNIERMQREAINLGEGPKFTIDISRHEYVADKQEHDLLGYRIFVYSPEMIVCEKLRAICQQMPDYGSFIKRNGAGKPRARDFIDIAALVQKFQVDLTTERAQNAVRQMFDLKKVPLDYLGNIHTTRDFHALDYESVKATMKPGVKLEPFEHYFDFVVDQCEKLEGLWHV